MPRTPFQPATYRLIPGPDGSTVAQVIHGTHIDGETLAARLYDYYVHRQDEGDELPTDLTIDTVLHHLGKQSTICVEGWHQSINEPGDEAAEITWKWARAQVERLFPELSWTVDPDQRHAMTWEHRG
ncbi:hypothetical protein [Streptomyces sp. NPDC001568]|uniref:hypothetical protein n=1 Tax=Streptomyces sp. NPDC001568 TaxID=3364588 RepID=UPI003687D2BB